MTIEQVWSFWLGELDEAGDAAPAAVKRWWTKDPAFDDEVRARFGPLHAEVTAGVHDGWREHARGALAYVVVLDQFARNMFRGTPAMFASDAQALAAAKAAVGRGFDRELPRAARAFFYLPYMHSEDLVDQDACIALLAAAPGLEANLAFGEQHRAIIRRFGRFPHRNTLLGRVSTAEEEAFLLEPGSSF